MAFGLANFWRWDGKVSRSAYAAVGVIGFAVKHNIDRFIVANFFPVPNTSSWARLFNYWAPLGATARLHHLSPLESKFLMVMLLAALPFIWVGVTMTVQRLRDAGEPVWLAAGFFVPFLNLLLFALLCMLPPRERPAAGEGLPWPGPRALDRLIPRSKTGSGLLAMVLTASIGLVVVLVETAYGGGYGWSLFLGLPFCLGLFSVLVYSYHEPRSVGDCVFVAIVPVALLGFGLIAVAVEGAVCVLMAAPLGLGLAALGSCLGYLIQARHWGSEDKPAMLSAVLLTVPALFGAERAAKPMPPTFVVNSSVEIRAAPQEVWNEVVAFAEIPPPTELLFRSGIAYPIRAEITGRGPGAVRQCIFSTGPFVEPIQVWDEPRLLRFGVTSVPAPLEELSPYGHIEPRHLYGYFASEKGQFLLTPLADGGTRLEGTTWYRNAIWPSSYWKLWSDYIIHRIHLRVLNHIKREVERSAAP